MEITVRELIQKLLHAEQDALVVIATITEDDETDNAWEAFEFQAQPGRFIITIPA